MRILLLIVVAFVFSVLSYAEENLELLQPQAEKRILICNQLSDSQCFGRKVDSICIVNAQKGQAGFCRPHANPYDSDFVTCYCF